MDHRSPSPAFGLLAWACTGFGTMLMRSDVAHFLMLGLEIPPIWKMWKWIKNTIFLLFQVSEWSQEEFAFLYFLYFFYKKYFFEEQADLWPKILREVLFPLFHTIYKKIHVWKILCYYFNNKNSGAYTHSKRFWLADENKGTYTSNFLL